jgi:hypothetical protein
LQNLSPTGNFLPEKTLYKPTTMSQHPAGNDDMEQQHDMEIDDGDDEKDDSEDEQEEEQKEEEEEEEEDEELKDDSDDSADSDFHVESKTTRKSVSKKWRPFTNGLDMDTVTQNFHYIVEREKEKEFANWTPSPAFLGIIYRWSGKPKFHYFNDIYNCTEGHGGDGKQGKKVDLKDFVRTSNL